MAKAGPEASSNQLIIQFPPEDMPPIIAQAVVDESRRGEGPSVVVTGDWHKVRDQMLTEEITEDVASGRQTRI